MKIYIRDLKRKIKCLLQIQDNSHQRGTSSERTNSQKSQQTGSTSNSTPMTPTIIIQKVEDLLCASALNTSTQMSSATTDSGYIGRYSYAEHYDQLTSIKLVDQALNAYLQASALTNSFDLNKIIEVGYFIFFNKKVKNIIFSKK